MATLADRFAKVVCAGALAEKYEDWTDGGDAGCYNDDVHLDAANDTVSLRTVEKNTAWLYSAVYMLTRSTSRAQ